MGEITGRYKAFAERLREACAYAGVPLKQKDVGKAFGVSGTMGWNYINGEKMPSTDRAVQIAERLGVSFEWLMTGRGQLLRADDKQQAPQLAAEQPPLYPARPDVLQVPVMAAAGSMGRGLPVPEHDLILDYMRLSIEWVRRNLTISRPDALRIVIGYGDSMTPTFNDGDPLLVDTGVTDLKLDAVYALARDDELFIKRVQRRLDGSLIIRSDNPLYDPMEIASPEAAGIRVLGRIVWAWNGKKL